MGILGRGFDDVALDFTKKWHSKAFEKLIVLNKAVKDAENAKDIKKMTAAADEFSEICEAVKDEAYILLDMYEKTRRSRHSEKLMEEVSKILIAAHDIARTAVNDYRTREATLKAAAHGTTSIKVLNNPLVSHSKVLKRYAQECDDGFRRLEVMADEVEMMTDQSFKLSRKGIGERYSQTSESVRKAADAIIDSTLRRNTLSVALGRELSQEEFEKAWKDVQKLGFALKEQLSAYNNRYYKLCAQKFLEATDDLMEKLRAYALS